MLFILLFYALSEFQPYQNPQCIAENKCPDSIEKELLSISENQFCGCQYPKSTVKISESITKIPKYAFYGSKIEKIMLHSNIQIIEMDEYLQIINALQSDSEVLIMIPNKKIEHFSFT